MGELVSLELNSMNRLVQGPLEALPGCSHCAATRPRRYRPAGQGADDRSDAGQVPDDCGAGHRTYDPRGKPISAAVATACSVSAKQDNPQRLAEILVEFWRRNDRVVVGIKKVGDS